MPWLRFELAGALVMSGRLGEAELQTQATVEVPHLTRQDSDALYRLGLVYLSRNLLEQSAEQFRRLVRLNAADGRGPGRVALAWILAASEDPEVRNATAALELGEGGREPLLLCARALAQAELGSTQLALRSARRALGEARKREDLLLLGIADDILSRLNLGEAFQQSGEDMADLLTGDWHGDLGHNDRVGGAEPGALRRARRSESEVERKGGEP